MAITKTPALVQPAYNEVVVTDSSSNALLVSESGSTYSRAVTLYRVMVDSQIRFNLKSFVSGLFYDASEAITTSAPGWAFRDHNLYAQYTFAGSNNVYTVLNAAYKKGEELDANESGETGFLTRRESKTFANNGVIDIPVYSGYPAGVTVIDKAFYTDDLENSVYTSHLELTITTTNYTATLPFGSTQSFTVIWGDGSFSNHTGTNNARHLYATPGVYQVYVYAPNGSILINNSANNYGNILSNFYVFGSTVTGIIYAFYRCTILTSVNRSLFANVIGRDFICNYLFNEASNLTTVPSDCFADINITGINYMFSGCTRLTNIYSDWFNNSPTLTSAIQVFANCQALTAIPADIFSNDCFRETLNAQYCFAGCIRITNLPTTALFPNRLSPNQTIDISYIFRACTGLVAINPIVFSGLAIIAGTGIFEACTITAVPANLFGNATSIQGSISRLFYNCTSLTTVDSNAFAQCANVTNIQAMFYTCRSLVEFPAGVFLPFTSARNMTALFQGCVSLTNTDNIVFNSFDGSVQVLQMFSGCTALTSVREDIFQPFITRISDITQIFYACSRLRSIGKLFSGATLLNNAVSAFNQCSAITEIQEDVFEGCTALQIVQYAFTGCSSLRTVTTELFQDCKRLNFFYFTFQNCVSWTGLTPVTPEGYRLWERAGKEGYPTEAAITSTGCFRACTELTEYAEIPDTWK